ncbi:MAG TPA: hypothetical protein VHX86_08725 [Tepidisphaeraceae bacterium]|jgi:hypothetical protein|nr:hypothetical protein [Tepidisphaeraceae bacterium]
MNQHTTKSGIVYYRLVKDETPPNGLARFVVVMKNPANNFNTLRPSFLAAKSRDDADNIVSEDYPSGHLTN